MLRSRSDPIRKLVVSRYLQNRAPPAPAAGPRKHCAVVQGSAARTGRAQTTRGEHAPSSTARRSAPPRRALLLRCGPSGGRGPGCAGLAPALADAAAGSPAGRAGRVLVLPSVLHAGAAGGGRAGLAHGLSAVGPAPDD